MSPAFWRLQGQQRTFFATSCKSTDYAALHKGTQSGKGGKGGGGVLFPLRSCRIEKGDKTGNSRVASPESLHIQLNFLTVRAGNTPMFLPFSNRTFDFKSTAHEPLPPTTLFKSFPPS